MKRNININEKEKQQAAHSGRHRLLIGLLAMFALPSVSVYAESEIYKAEGPKGEGTVIGGLSATDAAEGFIHQAFFHDDPAAVGASANMGERLTGPERGLYMKLKETCSAMTQRTEAGDELTASTIVRISVDELAEFFPQTEYTAEELGVETIIVDDEISQEAANAFYEKFEIDAAAAVDALLADSPYDYYWFDKTKGYYYSYPAIGTYGKSIFFDPKGYYEIGLYVAEEYAAGRTAETTDFDRSFTNAVCDAADTAAAIVKTHKNDSDIAKLYAYKDEICDRVSYNHAAADNDDTPYGNPWQAVWVFDGDPDTNVVCEGYSKAFQYLCDLSAFHTPIYTICVSGTMNGGAHMWNIVAMDDGKRFMADVTNCDEGSIGEPYDLFMAGYTAYRPENPLPEYDFLVKGETITYIYDDRTVKLFRSSELNMTNQLFDPKEYPEANEEGEPDTLYLPKGLKVIEEEAFAGIASEMVVVPDGCTAIRSRAFYACPNLTRVILPDSCQDIAADAFEGCGEIQFD